LTSGTITSNDSSTGNEVTIQAGGITITGSNASIYTQHFNTVTNWVNSNTKVSISASAGSINLTNGGILQVASTTCIDGSRNGNFVDLVATNGFYVTGYQVVDASANVYANSITVGGNLGYTGTLAAAIAAGKNIAGGIIY
jgi:hypothetical protein